MKTFKEYRAQGLAALKGNWPQVLIATILITIVAIIIYLPYFGAIFSVEDSMAYEDPTGYLGIVLWPFLLYLAGAVLFIYPLSVGYASAFRKLHVDNDDNVAANTFKDTFKPWGRNVWGMFLMYLFIGLWSLLLYIPGIIKTFSYIMTPYILKDYPELSANQAINLSRKMMKGHKFDFFCLMLSFIGWIILCCFTFGIGLIWLMPYMSSTMTAYYLDLKAEYESK